MLKPKQYEVTPEQRRIAAWQHGKPGYPGSSGSDNLTVVNSVLWVLFWGHTSCLIPGFDGAG